MTGNEALVKLQELKAGGASHSTLVSKLQEFTEFGFEISDDKTMILAYFHRTRVLVAPYSEIQLINC